MNRRAFLAAAGAAAIGAVASSPTARAQETAVESQQQQQSRDGRIKQGVCQWCFNKMSVEDLCAHAARIGLVGIDLVGPEHFATLKKHDLVGTMTPTHSLTEGLCNPANHAKCLAQIRDAIDKTAEAGFPNVICFSGNRGGIADDEGLVNCADALKQVVGLAEERGITICMELLNSKLNHKDYMCDSTPWGAELVNRVGSPRFKLLYDIYHMQVDEGDVIATIRQHKDAIGHYHTAGVPGRNEIDESQELYYPAIMRAIAETGFDGYVCHEFIPKRDPIASLEQAARICAV